MRVVALLTVRNETRYLRRCLTHLAAQGVLACVIDNDSIDDTRAIADEFVRSGSVVRVERLPFEGFFDLRAQMSVQQRLAGELEADWFLHHDADEIMEAPDSTLTLRQAIEQADAMGANAINFDEFVFVPAPGESFEGRDYVSAASRYYFFEPYSTRLVRGWKAGTNPELVSTGGHGAQFEGRRIHPQNFILRHYIVLSAEHALAKYGTRVFNPDELADGWHGWRPFVRQEVIRLPDPSHLKSLVYPGEWDRSDPQSHHMFILHEAAK